VDGAIGDFVQAKREAEAMSGIEYVMVMHDGDKATKFMS
jgi:hypothetical protein